MPNHVECCTAPVLAWIAKHMLDVPVNVMDQYHPGNFCYPQSQKYRPQHADRARRGTEQEIRNAHDLIIASATFRLLFQALKAVSPRWPEESGEWFLRLRRDASSR